jgi:hypothetical protein
MNRIATKILMALAAVAVPALAVAGFLGWMLITTVQEVGSDVEEALSTQRRIAQIRVLMEKESGWCSACRPNSIRPRSPNMRAG